jgi:hypothetical protein
MESSNKVRENKPPKGRGRPKGSPNKTTALVKDAILAAADTAGGKGGMAAYLASQAAQNPGPFMALLGKVLPLQVTGANGGAVIVEIVKRTYSENPATG